MRLSHFSIQTMIRVDVLRFGVTLSYFLLRTAGFDREQVLSIRDNIVMT